MLAFTSTSYPDPYFNHTPIDDHLVDFLDYSPNTVPQLASGSWKSAMEKMKKQMYSTTSAAVPCPATFFPRKDRPQFSFNADPFSAKDSKCTASYDLKICFMA